ncbi:ABC transporter ATP-binding protein [Albidovulum sp.]|uniref:ABC transporter ATP-binding protein n=1 Tax=Albidovulum sp. TaxID=1872424 RepID=UPI0035289BD9
MAPAADPAPEPGPVAGAAALVRMQGVTKSFGSFTAVESVDLDLRAGEFFSLLGPSGCGKSTLLRMIAGFEEPTRGTIAIDGRPMAEVAPNRRPTNMVFQSYAIFPHLNVADNIAFGLRSPGQSLSRTEIAARVDEMLATVGLGGLGQRGANELSGGQRQRVALARALILRPKVLLLDEPLSALDKKLREQMQIELRRLQRQVGITFLMVTHDQYEAMTISDRCGVMFGGRLAQVASPKELYQRPVTRQVAEFIGGINFLSGRVSARDAESASVEVKGFGTVTMPTEPAIPAAGGQITLGLRPERFYLAPERPAETDVAAAATVEDFAFYGETIHYYLRLDGYDAPVIAAVTNFQRAAHFAPGDRLFAGFRGRALVALP